jgi:hypothetical protein
VPSDQGSQWVRLLYRRTENPPGPLPKIRSGPGGTYEFLRKGATYQLHICESKKFVYTCRFCPSLCLFRRFL